VSAASGTVIPAPEQGTNAFVCTMGTADYDETEAKILQAGGGEGGQHLWHPPARRERRLSALLVVHDPVAIRCTRCASLRELP